MPELRAAAGDVPVLWIEAIDRGNPALDDREVVDILLLELIESPLHKRTSVTRKMSD
jgi:hypothetical protein